MLPISCGIANVLVHGGYPIRSQAACSGLVEGGRCSSMQVHHKHEIGLTNAQISLFLFVQCWNGCSGFHLWIAGSLDADRTLEGWPSFETGQNSFKMSLFCLLPCDTRFLKTDSRGFKCTPGSDLYWVRPLACEGQSYLLWLGGALQALRHRSFMWWATCPEPLNWQCRGLNLEPSAKQKSYSSSCKRALCVKWLEKKDSKYFMN